MARSRSPARRRSSRERHERYSHRPRSRSRDRDDRRDSRHSSRRHDAERDRRSASPRRRSPKPERDSRGDSRAVVRRSPSRSRSKSASASGPSLEPNFNPSGLLAAATKSVAHGDGTSTVLKYHEKRESQMLDGDYMSSRALSKLICSTFIARAHFSSAETVWLLTYRSNIRRVPNSMLSFNFARCMRKINSAKGSPWPFVIDLDSTNGTMVNGEAIPTSRYYELKASDVIKFGTSAREYVLLHDEGV